ncbi:hypothetical protein HZH68_000606 [Vespula germanica]|uniref:Uncharacterized protein n=1 Tax=Vespula germanica TaxID=30212 RepID=A0A834NTY3_VESGE|nr:hypothetical protein HZH68_000606 [Vespula germanica]
MNGDPSRKLGPEVRPRGVQIPGARNIRITVGNAKRTVTYRGVENEIWSLEVVHGGVIRAVKQLNSIVTATELLARGTCKRARCYGAQNPFVRVYELALPRQACIFENAVGQYQSVPNSPHAFASVLTVKNHRPFSSSGVFINLNLIIKSFRSISIGYRDE